MQAEHCRDCKFYCLEEEFKEGRLDDSEFHPDDYEAECRRYPPVRGDAEHYGTLSEMNACSEGFSGPIVKAVGWCGEWRARAA